MTVESLSSELQQLVQQGLATGKYPSENDFLLEAVRLLAERDRRLEELRREIQIGRDQIDRGEYTDYDEVSLRKYFDELQERGRQRYEASKKST
jgi:antitoxin ParD1/3/4